MAKNIVEIIIKAVDLASGEFLKAEQNSKGLAGTVGKLAAQLGLAALAGAALRKGLDFTKESALLAARVETLGVVTQVMGKNAGISAGEISELEAGIQSMGITTQASRQALAQMMRAQIDLSKATDLARLAQDAAVISGENSSQAFEKLTLIIGTGNTLMARRMGLLVDFQGAYKSLAASLDKPVDQLTQLEKVQARTNEVMAQGETIAGAYTAAMETAGKQILSYDRYLEALKLSIGDELQPALKTGIGWLTEWTKGLLETREANLALNKAVEDGLISKEKAHWLSMDMTNGLTEASEVQEILTEVTEAWLDTLTEEDRKLIELAANLALVKEKTEEATASTSRYGEAQEMFAGRAQAGINALNKTKNAINEAKAAAEEAAGAMTEYFDLFDNTENVEVAASLTDELSDYLVAAAAAATAAGKDAQPWLAALEILDPVAFAAAESSSMLAGTLDALDSALSAKAITPQEYADAMNNIALGIDAGIAPSIAMETQLDKLGLSIATDTEVADLFQGSLDRLVQGSPYNVEVRTTYTERGKPPGGTIPDIIIPTDGGGGGGGKRPPRGRAAGGPVNAFDPYWVGERGPELIVPRAAGTVIPNDKASLSSGEGNEFHFHIANNMDIYEVAQQVIEILQ